MFFFIIFILIYHKVKLRIDIRKGTFSEIEVTFYIPRYDMFSLHKTLRAEEYTSYTKYFYNVIDKFCY